MAESMLPHKLAVVLPLFLMCFMWVPIPGKNPIPKVLQQNKRWIWDLRKGCDAICASTWYDIWKDHRIDSLNRIRKPVWQSSCHTLSSSAVLWPNLQCCDAFATEKGRDLHYEKGHWILFVLTTFYNKRVPWEDECFHLILLY